MVDELTQGLAALNEKIIVISPYYNSNKNGEIDYLSKDNINYVDTFWVNG
jgi:hypothetical protein